jgi:hypothetical protein
LSQFKDLSFASTTGPKTTFAEIKKQVAESGAPEVEGRLPHWFGSATTAPPMETTPLDDSNLLSGALLVPVESALAYRPPNLLFLKKGNSLRVYDTTKGADAFPAIGLPDDLPCVLLGVSGQQAILLQKAQVMGVDLKSRRVWAQRVQRAQSSLGAAPISDEERQQLPNGIRFPAGGVARINGQLVAIGPDGLPMEDMSSRPNFQGGGDGDLARRAAILSLDNPNYSFARLLNNKVLLISGNSLMAYNVENGEPAWRDRDGKPITVRLPDGRPVSLVGNEDVLVAQVDSADGSSSTFLTIDADTGQSRRTIRLKSDRALWRALGDDGRLYVVSNNAVAGYDLIGGTGDNDMPQWRRTDIQTRFATASALTLDGLIMVDSSLNIWCLSLESGEMRWAAPPRLPLISTVGTIMSLRSMVDGENVIFQSSQNSASYRSMPTGSNQVAWEAFYPKDTPTLQALELTDLHVVELAMGALNTTERAVRIVFRDRRGGRIAYSQDIVAQRGGAADRAGPMLKGWEVLDNGIALLVGDQTHFWRNKPADAPAETTKDGAKAP